MTKLYIDCTGTYRHNANTGIQRVVRNITTSLLKNASKRGVECIPVMCTNGAFHRCTIDEQGTVKQVGDISLNKRVRKGFNAARALICTVFPFQPVFAFCYASRYEFGLVRIAFGLLSAANKMLRPALRYFRQTDMLTAVDSGNEPRILLCADAGFTYLSEVRQALPPLAASGTKVITVIYDLIPINYAAYCSAQLTSAFDSWLRFAAAHSHALICISDAVRKEVAEFLPQLPDPKPADTKLDYFHLGFELDRVQGQQETRQLREQVFGDERPVFLMVGTIESRKNHEFVLRAFESLWRNGKDYKLCFLGRYGWNTGELMERLNTHPERGGRLFVCTDVSDADLQYAYKSAYGLICASLAEGFGLPLVEALARGLPVLASDLPVFREIAGSIPVYFNPRDIQSLRAAVIDYCQGGRAAAERRAAGFVPLSWQQSAEMLLTKLLVLADVEGRPATYRSHRGRALPEIKPAYTRDAEMSGRTKAL